MWPVFEPRLSQLRAWRSTTGLLAMPAQWKWQCNSRLVQAQQRWQRMKVHHIEHQIRTLNSCSWRKSHQCTSKVSIYLGALSPVKFMSISIVTWPPTDLHGLTPYWIDFAPIGFISKCMDNLKIIINARVSLNNSRDSWLKNFSGF